MSLSISSVTTLSDMIQERLGDMVITDREDAKEQMQMTKSLREVEAIGQGLSKGIKRKSSLATLSDFTITLLIDMVENRLSDMYVPAPEQSVLRSALQELAAASFVAEKQSKRGASKTASRRVSTGRPMLRQQLPEFADFAYN